MNDELTILYQDDHLVVIDKPSGLLVHRTELASQETDAVVQRLNQQLGKWVYPVHRLDRATSGLLIMAFTSHCAKLISQQFSDGKINKTYLAIVRGHTALTGTIDQPLAKLNENKGRSRFKIEGTERDAVTHFARQQVYLLPFSVSQYPTTRCSLVEVSTEQGRKHQIRRHFKHLRYPLIGDTRYGCRHHNKLFTELKLPLRLLLHASKIHFQHPITGIEMALEAPIPKDFQSIIDYLTQHHMDEKTVKTNIFV